MFKVGDKIRMLSDGVACTNLRKGDIQVIKVVDDDNSIYTMDGWGFDLNHFNQIESIEETIMEAYERDPRIDANIEELPKLADRYNSGKLRWHNVPMFILRPVAEVGAMAEKHPDNPKGKYGTYNYLRGLKANETLDSLKRHLDSFESPYESDLDKETGLPHLAHIAWNALALLHSLKENSTLDDRYKLPENTND